MSAGSRNCPSPSPISSWDNAAIFSGAHAKNSTLEEDDIVEISAGGGKVNAPVMAAPGHPDNSVTLYLGYGREVAGRVGSGMGFNAYRVHLRLIPFVSTGIR